MRDRLKINNREIKSREIQVDKEAPENKVSRKGLNCRTPRKVEDEVNNESSVSALQ